MSDDSFLVFEDSNLAESPATHALVIGVGDYPHLLGGSSPNQCANTEGMSQLSSPPVSARRIAEWLLRDYHFAEKPLGSLALLLSEGPPKPFAVPGSNAQGLVEVADSANVVKAVTEWERRANTHEDNRTIFYFCGHGTSLGMDMALLLSDFCANPQRPLTGALDFAQLKNGMRPTRASEQIYFVDACRAGTDTLIEAQESAGQIPLQGAARPADLPDLLAPVFYSTLGGAQAYGVPEAPSLFTAALLRALAGAAGDDSSGVWQIDTTSMKRAIDHFMREPIDAGEQTAVQIPPTSDLVTFELHRFAIPPKAPVYVRCSPTNAIATASLSCIRNGRVVGERPADSVDPEKPDRDWVVDVEPGQYEFRASFSTGAEGSQMLDARPMFRRVTLEGA